MVDLSSSLCNKSPEGRTIRPSVPLAGLGPGFCGGIAAWLVGQRPQVGCGGPGPRFPGKMRTKIVYQLPIWPWHAMKCHTPSLLNHEVCTEKQWEWSVTTSRDHSSGCLDDVRFSSRDSNGVSIFCWIHPHTQMHTYLSYSNGILYDTYWWDMCLEDPYLTPFQKSWPAASVKGAALSWWKLESVRPRGRKRPVGNHCCRWNDCCDLDLGKSRKIWKRSNYRRYYKIYGRTIEEKKQWKKTMETKICMEKKKQYENKLYSIMGTSMVKSMVHHGVRKQIDPRPWTLEAVTWKRGSLFVKTTYDLTFKWLCWYIQYMIIR